MTYQKLKVLSSALLLGDTKLPKDEEQILALIEMAYAYLVDKCQILNLQTEDRSVKVQRLGRGTHVVRKPELPSVDTDELDVDDELGSAVASLIASYVSEKKTIVHQTRADDVIRSYNAKVDEFLESITELTGAEG